MNAGFEWLLPLALGAVALVYSSVGHGGASGYLAVLALAGLPSKSVATTALVLNLVVAGLAFLAFRQAKRFSWRLTWPFLLGAAPSAYFGSSLKLSERGYFLLVGAVVCLAGFWLLAQRASAKTDDVLNPPPVASGLAIGIGIGFLSGLVGVGGGIFLSPILVLTRWADAKRAAATSAIFIFSNSAIGLAGRLPDGLQLPQQFPAMVACGALGALAGSWLGSKSIPTPLLRRVLGATLVVASIKLLLVPPAT